MFLLDDNLFRVFSILCFFIYKKIFIAYLLIFSKKDVLKRFAPLTYLSGRVFFEKRFVFCFGYFLFSFFYSFFFFLFLFIFFFFFFIFILKK